MNNKTFLEHHADIAAERRDLHVPGVDAVDQDVSGLRVEGPVQQRERGRFSGAGGTHHGDRLSGLGDEMQIDHSRPAAVIGKSHIP